MGRRTPARRETIEEHLSTAARALAIAGLPAAPKTRDWVRSLIQLGFLEGPRQVSRPGSRGLGRRFTPAAYRDLLELLRVSALGANKRTTWQVCLWLRGREFPLDDVRQSLVSDLTRQLASHRRELSPTGRFGDSFLTKYRRNIAPQMSGSPFGDLGALGEVLGALTMRPQALSVATKANDLAKLVADSLGVPINEVSAHFDHLAAHFASGTLSDVLGPLAASIPLGPLIAALGDVQANTLEMPDLTGLFDDGKGGSALLDRVANCSDAELIATRQFVIAIRTASFERALGAAMSATAAVAHPMLQTSMDWAAMQRRLLIGNPQMASYLFATILYGNSPPKGRAVPQIIDATTLLKTLRTGR